MGFNFLFDKIEPTVFGLNSMAFPMKRLGTRKNIKKGKTEQ